MAYSHSANYMNPNVVYVCVCACGFECVARYAFIIQSSLKVKVIAVYMRFVI